MAIDFPTPSQVGETFTSGSKTFICTVVGPPAVWSSGTVPPTPEEFVTIDTTQTISGLKVFSGSPLTATGDFDLNNLKLYADGGVEPTQATIGSSWDLQDGYVWKITSAITVPNPTNGVAGMNGLITVLAAPTAWGSNFVFSNNEDVGPPVITTFPTLLPYSVQSATQILIGSAITFAG